MITESQTNITTAKTMPELVMTTEKYETSKTAMTQKPTAEESEEVFTVNFDLTSSDTEQNQFLTSFQQTSSPTTSIPFTKNNNILFNKNSLNNKNYSQQNLRALARNLLR